jgi:hypothetical protein
MKGSIIRDGKRIEIGQRVEILAGPYRGRVGLFRGRKRNAKNKIVVTPWGSVTHVVMDIDAIRRLVRC